MLDKRRFIVNTQMLDRLMKPIIEEDLNRLDEKRGGSDIYNLKIKRDDKLLLKKHYNDNFGNNITYNIKHKNYTKVRAWYNIVCATIRMYSTLGYKGNYSNSTTMTAALSLSKRKFIKDAFNRKKDHNNDYQTLVMLKNTLSAFIENREIYDQNSGKRNAKLMKADKGYVNQDWTNNEKNYWDSQRKVSGEELWDTVFMNLNHTLKTVILPKNDTATVQSTITHLKACREVMKKKAGVTEGLTRKRNGLYRLIFENAADGDSIKQDILNSGLLEGEWPSRFEKASNKQQVIADISRLIELLENWRNAWEDAYTVKQQQQTPTVQNNGSTPAKIKAIDNEWHAFTFNKKLAPDYGYDFKRFALTRSRNKADKKDPGMINGYEGPKGSGTLIAASFTPDDFNAWLDAKKRGGNGIKSVSDEVKNLSKGYDKDFIAKVWQTTTGNEIVDLSQTIAV